ncbi:hypothetical protein J5N97_022961 [Dioscorea zingiberensis]|uniref:Uncharacterized protein n=1 Tax=Dioscorea zingiberensis TaxID=325984 RepID=A0A9D5HB45_9LILI|nr:hypothetical protein J5N97_022961 [Dioscorea zingiberensis]
MCTPEAGKEEEKEEASRDPKLSVSGDDAQPPPEKEMAISVGNDDAEVDREDNPSWFTPGRLLIIFCIINMLNYLDRGTIASNGVNGSRGTCKESGICTPGSGIQGDFKLTNFQDGALSSAFMVGLLVASPIFATLAKSHNPFRLIGVGLSVWTVAELVVDVPSIFGQSQFVACLLVLVRLHS